MSRDGPTTVRAPCAAMRLLIDGLNVAHWCGRPPSLRLPLALLAGLLEQGHAAHLVFDASAPHRLRQEHELYLLLRGQGAWCSEVPSGRSADGELLRTARRERSRIVSRDRFADHRRRYRKLIDEPGRVFGGGVTDDMLQLADGSITLPLPATAADAWARLQRVAVLIRG